MICAVACAIHSLVVGLPFWSSTIRSLRPLFGKAQHGEQEVLAAGSIHPARAQNQIIAANTLNGQVAIQLGLAINVSGFGESVSTQGLSFDPLYT